MCRKDSFYDTEADNDTASVQLCFIGVIVGLAGTWHPANYNGSEAGRHKKFDVAAVYRPVCIELLLLKATAFVIVSAQIYQSYPHVRLFSDLFACHIEGKRGHTKEGH
jgi:hypothetical protein